MYPAVAACGLQLLAVQAATFPGFTIEPPVGDEWRLVQKNAVSLVWMRRMPGATSTFGTAVLTQPLAADFTDPAVFLDWVRHIKEENPDPVRFRIRQSVLASAPEVAEFCVRYLTVIEDRTDPTSARVGLELRVAGIACLHPSDPHRYYDFQYSSRSVIGQQLPDSILDEGRTFVASVSFGPPPADGHWALGERASSRLEHDDT